MSNSNPFKVRLRSMIFAFGENKHSNGALVSLMLEWFVDVLYVATVPLGSVRCKRINTRVFLRLHLLPSTHPNIPQLKTATKFFISNTRCSCSTARISPHHIFFIYLFFNASCHSTNSSQPFFHIMASSFEGKQEVLDEPSSSSTSFPISPQKAEFASDEDHSSVTASEAATETPVQLFHKPPTKQFVLIMIAYVCYPFLLLGSAHNFLLSATNHLTSFVHLRYRLSLCVFLASLDQIIVSTSIPAITREYNSLGDISWLGTAYMLTATAFQPLYGKFSDIFGRKTTMLFANFLFLVGSAISGWATSMTMLIVGRGVAGVGAGGLMAMVFIILSDMLDMRERGKYLGFIGAIFSLSSVIGKSLMRVRHPCAWLVRSTTNLDNFNT